MEYSIFEAVRRLDKLTELEEKYQRLSKYNAVLSELENRKSNPIRKDILWRTLVLQKTYVERMNDHADWLKEFLRANGGGM